MGINHKLILLCIVVLSGNCLVGYTAYKRNEKQNESEALLEHTEKIIELSNGLADFEKNIKQDVRNFTITRDSTYLAGIKQNKALCNKKIAALIYLTLGNATQQRLLDSLNVHLNADARSSLQIEGVQENFHRERAKQIISKIQTEERMLLMKRKRCAMKSVVAFDNINILMYILMTVFMVLLLVLSAIHLVHLKEKEKKILELSLAYKKIKFRTNERKEKSAALTDLNRELLLKNSEADKLALELTLANNELMKTEADQKEYIAELEKMMYMISHEVRQPIAHLMGLSNLFDYDEHSSINGVKKIVGFMKGAITSLDVFTRDLTRYVGSIVRKRKD